MFAHDRIVTNPQLNTIDVNECLNSSLSDCDVNASCMDTFGSYMCSCNDGYFGNGFNCSGKLLSIVMSYYNLTCLILYVDLDECLEFQPCDSNATCLNTIGSFICTCNEGFTGNGSQCDGKNLILL